ncbi:hypothetical protein VFPFJ_04248 [Purpureocillium lilacinum]|uniref:DUF967 domain protein n=1 Tax=Purpureocillium lilacinum TaxID=33203 RepID=A0A179HQ81_PURLI|nr:hypothetical protein VFPFJ_04248 [Purpureocillium lilacinum]OAQ92507.1 hypothetical protein VFPFJ_04248 [Purpureocillium lilacinum]
MREPTRSFYPPCIRSQGPCGLPNQRPAVAVVVTRRARTVRRQPARPPVRTPGSAITEDRPRTPVFLRDPLASSMRAIWPDLPPADPRGGKPPAQLNELIAADAGGEGFTLTSFTASDAWELGHLLHARLLPFATQCTPSRPALISISLASNPSTPLYQSATGAGITADNGTWVSRKRAAVLRFGVSSWYLGRKFGGDEAAFAAKFAMGPESAGGYAIHGGGVPLRVRGVEGVVAVVVVSGLKDFEDHGVVAEVIRRHWEVVVQ